MVALFSEIVMMNQSFFSLVQQRMVDTLLNNESIRDISRELLYEGKALREWAISRFSV